MALVKCPECGHEVDEAAVACPNCGCPASEWKTPNAADWAADDGFVDYYAILGVSSDATVAQMAQAYRRAALKHHPDRGGSHEDMARVNEAWEVLSDPDKRREYDQLRTQVPDSGARAGWTEKTEDVRRRAQEYPRQWSDFERWMHKFVDDVTAADYGTEKLGPATFPTAGRSVSGCLMIGCGGVLGLVALLALIVFVETGVNAALPGANAHFQMPQLFWIAAVLMFASGGAWVGAKAHKVLRDAMEGNRRARASSAAEGTPAGGSGGNQSGNSGIHNRAPGQQPVMAEVVTQDTLRCPICNQSLRVPKVGAEITVTCPKCKSKFNHNS